MTDSNGAVSDVWIYIIAVGGAGSSGFPGFASGVLIITKMMSAIVMRPLKNDGFEWRSFGCLDLHHCRGRRWFVRSSRIRERGSDHYENDERHCDEAVEERRI